MERNPFRLLRTPVRVPVWTDAFQDFIIRIKRERYHWEPEREMSRTRVVPGRAQIGGQARVVAALTWPGFGSQGESEQESISPLDSYLHPTTSLSLRSPSF